VAIYFLLALLDEPSYEILLIRIPYSPSNDFYIICRFDDAIIVELPFIIINKLNKNNISVIEIVLAMIVRKYQNAFL